MSERDARESARIQGIFRVKFPSIDWLVIAYSRDFSRGGMFLATEQFLPLNAVIRLEIDLPEDGGRIPVIASRVRATRRTPARAASRPAWEFSFLISRPRGVGSLGKVRRRPQHDVGRNRMDRARPGSAESCTVVEDDKASAECAARAFRERGDKVRTALDGLHGLAECLKRPPDAVVSDVQMPRMDRWQLVRVLRSRPSLSSIPVLFLTQVWGESERLRGYKLGVDDFIPKPWGPEELLARVDRAIERAQRPGSNLTQRKTLRGDLAQVSLASVLSFLELEKRTGVLLLVGDNTARIYIDAGRPLKVDIDGAPSESSQRTMMGQMLDWTMGQFEFGAQDVACPDELRTSLTALLLEHARVQDEKRK